MLYNYLLPVTVGMFQLNSSAKKKGRILIVRQKSEHKSYTMKQLLDSYSYILILTHTSLTVILP